MKDLLKFISPNKKQKSPLDSGPPHYSNPIQLTDPSYVNQGHHQLSLGYQNILPLYNQPGYDPTPLPHFSHQQHHQTATHPHALPNLYHHNHHTQTHQHQHQPIQSSSTCTCYSPSSATTNLQSPQQAMTTSYSAYNFGYQCTDSTLQDTSAQVPYKNSAVATANATVAPYPQTLQYQNFSTQSTVFQTTGPVAHSMVPTDGIQQHSSRSCDQQSYYSNQASIMTSPQQQYQNQRSQQPSFNLQCFQQPEPRTNSTNNPLHNGHQHKHQDQKYRHMHQQQQQPRTEQQQTQTHQITNDMKQLEIAQQQQQQYQNHNELTNGHNEELPLEPAYLMYERDYEELHKTAGALRVDIQQLGKELDAIRKRHPYEVFMDII